MELVFLQSKSTPPYSYYYMMNSLSSSQPKRKEKKESIEWGSEMVLTVLRHSFMGTSPINVAACAFQREIPSLNVVVFLVSLSQRVSPSCSTSFFPLCPLLTLTKCAHVSFFNYTSTLLPPSLGLLFNTSSSSSTL